MRYSRRLPSRLLTSSKSHDYVPDTVASVRRYCRSIYNVSVADLAINRAAMEHRTKDLWNIAQYFCQMPSAILRIVLSIGDLQSLIRLHEIGRVIPFYISYEFISYSHWNILDWIHKTYPKWTLENATVIMSASLGGLAWCRRNGYNSPMQPMRYLTMRLALWNGVLDEEYACRILPGGKFTVDELSECLSMALECDNANSWYGCFPCWNKGFALIARNMDWESEPNALAKLRSCVSDDALPDMIVQDLIDAGCPAS